MNIDWRGVFPAGLTQFDPDQSLNTDATIEHFESMVAAGVHGIIVLGTMGENSSLEFNEKLDILQATVARFGHDAAGAIRQDNRHRHNPKPAHQRSHLKYLILEATPEFLPSCLGGNSRADQNVKVFACCTCGNARTAASTCEGSSPSISISAIALPPGASRPTWKVAILMPASPNMEEKRPMNPGLSRLVM